MSYGKSHPLVILFLIGLFSMMLFAGMTGDIFSLISFYSYFLFAGFLAIHTDIEFYDGGWKPI